MPHEELDRIELSSNWARLTTSRVRIVHPDGSESETWREAYDRGDGAVILPYDPDRRHVLLVRQFRWPAAYNGEEEPALIEAAAGQLDDTDPVARIRAEAEEELGLSLADPRELFVAYSSPGSVTERLHYFVARYGVGDAAEGFAGAADEDERTEVLDLPFDAAMAMAADGRIRDAKTIILLQWAALNVFSG